MQNPNTREYVEARQNSRKHDYVFHTALDVKKLRVTFL